MQKQRVFTCCVGVYFFFRISGKLWWKLSLGVWLAGILERVKGGRFLGISLSECLS